MWAGVSMRMLQERGMKGLSCKKVSKFRRILTNHIIQSHKKWEVSQCKTFYIFPNWV